MNRVDKDIFRCVMFNNGRTVNIVSRIVFMNRNEFYAISCRCFDDRAVIVIFNDISYFVLSQRTRLFVIDSSRLYIFDSIKIGSRAIRG